MAQKRLLVFVAVMALVMSGAAFAQEQVGAIEGVVVDNAGVALPGVTVEALTPAGNTLMSVTDSNGIYRFPRLSVGTYKLTAKLAGFVTSEAGDIRLTLGKNVKVNFSLRQGAITEEITVTGGQTQIDVKQAATSTTIGLQELELLPRGRDFTSVVAQAAGSNQENFLGGISIDGASGSENRFVIDGIDTTNPRNGLSGQNLITDFAEEVQVKSAGYTAEYGGAVGGVVNAITKTGSKDWHGSVLMYLNDSKWDGAQRPSSYEANCPSCLITYNKDKTTRFEPGFSLGGPVLSDSLWFFVAYQPSTYKLERTPLFNVAGDGPATRSYKQTTTDQFLTANLKGSVGSSFFYKLAMNRSPQEVENALAPRDREPAPGVNLGVTNKYPSESYSLYTDFVASNNFLMSGRLGYFMTDHDPPGANDRSRFLFHKGTIPVPETDPRFQPTGYSSVPNASFQSTKFDKWERKSAALDSTFFFEGLGSHEVKAGVQYENIKNKVLTGENGNLFIIRWLLPDRFGMGIEGTYGSVEVRSFKTDGAAESTNWALFLQDSWLIAKNFTLNIGVRAEQERVPNYGAARDPSLPANAMAWDFGDKLAPRIGFSWDVMGDAKLKAYGSYGNYYDITKLAMPRGSFGADRWISYFYPLETLDWQTLNAGCTISTNNASINPCPALGTPTTRDLRKPTDPAENIDPNLKPMENREFQLGADYQMWSTGVVGFRYVNKKLLNTIEDIGYLVWTGNVFEEVYITGNPGKGIVVKDYVPGKIPPQAEAIRDYQALELRYNHRFADNWSLGATYTYSELTGNYSGLASSDEFGRTDPNIERYFDGLVYGYDSKGKLVDGVLNTDRPHAIELYGLYRFNFGTSVGFGPSWRSGSPVTQDEQFNGINFFPYGRNNLGRLDNITQTDLYLAHPISLGTMGSLGKMQLEINLNISNLFDEKTVTRVDNAKWDADLCDYLSDCSYDYYFTNVVPYDFDGVMTANDAPLNPTFMKPIAYQEPRTIRLGFKLTF